MSTTRRIEDLDSKAARLEAKFRELDGSLAFAARKAS
jgi:hypothetical protein